ncbi:MAG: VaFE repeat-containing surface-anchored protein [Anaerovoracaceae bacterium]
MNRKTELKQKFKQLLTIAFASMMVLGSALPAVTETASAFTGKVGSSYTVTDGGRITYGSGDGGYSNSRKCDLGDGLGSRYTYCVQPAKASPPTGKVTVDKVITDADDKGKWNALRNIVFYSPSYPGYEKNTGNIKGAYYTGNFTKDWAIAHLAMAYVYEGRPSDMATWGGTKASGLGDIWTKAKKLGDGLWNADSEKDAAIPGNFKVFISTMSGVQDMVAGYLEDIRGGFRVQKIDNDLDEPYAQGDASLEGAEFTAFNKSGHAVFIGEKKIDQGEAAVTIRTDKTGLAKSSADALPYGDYLVKETKAPSGYLLNDKWSRAISIRKDGEIIDITSDPVKEEIQRGGVQIVKRDKELKKSEALGGADLNGIEMTIKNVSGHDVVVRTDIGSAENKVDWKVLSSKKDLIDSGKVKRVKSGEDVGKITVRWNEAKKAYTAETLPDDLPYGTYTIRETKTNKTYQRTDKSEHMFKIREDGKTVSYDDGQNEMALTFDDYVYRSDVQGTKIGDGDSRRFAFVPFKITAASNGETHVVVTDKNGFFSTKDRRTAGDLEEEEGKDNARRQNPFDDLLNEKQISAGSLKKRADQIRCGVFFGTGQFGSKAAMITGVGALPYDTYTIEEMRCENNKGYVLQKFSFTVDEKSRDGLVDLETITDDLITIGTKAKAEKTGTNLSAAEKDVKLIDTVSYTNLVPGKEYVLKGKLMDQKTGKELLLNGKPVISQKKFVPEKKDGTVDVEFVFSGTGLAGTSTVVFEDLYENDVNIASHAEIKDEGQTIHFPEVKTHAEDQKTKDEVGETRKETTIVDKVNYRNLIPGKEYTVRGVLMDKETVKPVTVNGKTVTSEKKFTADKADGTVEMNFTFDASSLRGKTTVVFEDLFYEGIKVASHGDLTDHDQTIWHPEIRTTAKDSRSGTHEATRDKKVCIVDTVSYHNLVVGKEYTVRGVLMNKETGKPVRDGFSAVTSEKKFTAEKKDGTIGMQFTFDAEKLQGADVVVFEDLIHNGITVTSHSDLSDKDQTVHFPKKPEKPGTPTETPAPPKTGDRTKLLGYIALMLAAGTAAAGIAYKRRRLHKLSEDQDDLKK